MSQVRDLPGEPSLLFRGSHPEEFVLPGGRFGKQIKWLPVGGRELSVLPGAVRNHEIQQAPLFPCRPFLEEHMGASGEFEELDSVLEVALVGVLMFLDRLEEPALLSPPLGRLSLVELEIDSPVQPVDVHSVEAVLEALMLGPETREGLLMFPLLVLVALLKGVGCG
jgi:hypothetical protein